MNRFRQDAFVRLLVLCSVIVLTAASGVWAAKPLVLFDEGHAQKAGNADWVIDGGFSDFADAFKDQGCEVRAIKVFTPEAIRQAAVLVLPEPNSVYTKAEQDAIVRFVENGGALYAIADHDRSDRNGDGIDSVGVLNQFLPRLGLKIDKRYFTEAPTRGEMAKTEFTTGVKAVGTWGGTTVSCLAQSAVAHITVSAKNGGGAYIASNVVGPKGGKVIAMGDSSPYDDGTGDPRDKLYDGYNNPKFQHDRLAVNSIRWLLKRETPSPRRSMAMMMTNLDQGHQQLRQTPTDELFSFVEATETGLGLLVREHPELAEDFSARAADKPAFSRIQKSLSTTQRFNDLHR